MVIKFSLKSVPSLSSMTPGDSVSVVKLNPRQQLSHAWYTADSWSADRQPAQIRQDQRPVATIDQHLLLHHTMAESGRQAGQVVGGDRAERDGSADRHLLRGACYARTMHPPQARGGRARNGAGGCPSRRGW